MNKLDEQLQRIQEVDPVTLAAVGTGLGIANLIMMAYRTYKDYFTKEARQCMALPPQEKTICMLTAKYHALNVQLQSLKGAQSKCKDDKCKLKVQKKMQNVMIQMKAAKKRVGELKANATKS